MYILVFSKCICAGFFFIFSVHIQSAGGIKFCSLWIILKLKTYVILNIVVCSILCVATEWETFKMTKKWFCLLFFNKSLFTSAHDACYQTLLCRNWVMTFYVMSPNFDILSVIIIFLLANSHYENILKRTIPWSEWSKFNIFIAPQYKDSKWRKLLSLAYIGHECIMQSCMCHLCQ